MDTTASCGQAVVLTADTQLRQRLEEQLSSHGFEVRTIEGFAEIPELRLTHPPVLTVVDLDGAFPNDGNVGHAPKDSAEAAEGKLLEACQSLGTRVILPLVSPASIGRLPMLAGQTTTHLRKPFSPEELDFFLTGIEAPQRPPSRVEGGLHGASPQIQGVRKLAHQVAASAAHVTITGEAGVGKRRVGRLIHACGPRERGPFLQVGCAGFSARLLESVFFGGAASAPGCLVEGRGGTVLIDDIDVMPPSLQERLFHYLNSDGAGDTVQVIAVSSRDLDAQVRAGAFHHGLFDLVSPAQIEVPPLRERKADIPILADRFTRSFQGGQRRIGPAVVQELMRYDWPGNVRELRDILEHAMEASSSSVLSVEDLPSLPESPASRADAPNVPGATIHEIERDAILRTLDALGGSTSKAARVLQMSVRKIQYKLKEYRTEASSLAATESRPSLAERRTPSRKSRVAASPGKR